MAAYDQLIVALKNARLAQAAQMDAILDLRDAKALRLEDQIHHGRKRYMHGHTVETINSKVAQLRKLDLRP